MSLAVAIAVKDRIIIGADGRVFDTEKGVTNRPKLFKLCNNCATAVTGMGLENHEVFLETIRANVKNQKIIGADSVAKYVKQFASQRTWAKYKTPKKSHICMLIAGYENHEPKIYVLLSTGKLENIPIKRYVVGNWSKAIDFMVDNLNDVFFDIDYQTAERITTEILVMGALVNSKDIGGDGLVWHIFPNRVSMKSKNYAISLQRKYRHNIKRLEKIKCLYE